MAKFGACVGTVLLLTAALAGCAASPVRSIGLRSSPEPFHPTCDTSVEYIDLFGRITNRSGGGIAFQLDDYEGPPFDPAYMAYRVYASAPGKPMQLVHNSGHDSEWDRVVGIAPGDAVMLHIPLFGLRPADYYHYFRIEIRDERNTSYWTPEFQLCAMIPADCTCATPVAGTTGAQPPRLACPAALKAGVGGPETAREFSLLCR